MTRPSILILAVAILLAGCGSDGAASGASGGDDGTVTLTVSAKPSVGSMSAEGAIILVTASNGSKQERVSTGVIYNRGFDIGELVLTPDRWTITSWVVGCSSRCPSEPPEKYWSENARLANHGGCSTEIELESDEGLVVELGDPSGPETCTIHSEDVSG